MCTTGDIKSGYLRKSLHDDVIKWKHFPRWRHNGCAGVSNHHPYDCLLNRLFRHRSKETSKLGVTGLCVGNSPRTGEFPAQMASNAENASITWRHHVVEYLNWYAYCSDIFWTSSLYLQSSTTTSNEHNFDNSNIMCLSWIMKFYRIAKLYMFMILLL